MHLEQYKELYTLLDALCETTITPEQLFRLESMVSHDVEMQKRYVEYMMFSADLHKTLASHSEDHVSEENKFNPQGQIDVVQGSPRTHGHVADLLIDQEQWNPDEQCENIKAYAENALEQFKQDERRRQEELAYKAYVAGRRRLIVGIASAAALILITFMAWMFEPKQEGYTPPVAAGPVDPPVVARITDSVNAQWRVSGFPTAKGTLLRAVPRYLEQGLVRVEFLDGAEVILQAPCRVQLQTAGRLFLQSGTISAVVPKRATGFVVETVSGKIKDYGTEFGVIARHSGEAETHVYKGSVSLESNSNRSWSVSAPRMLTQGHASSIDTFGKITDRQYRPDQIVREMPQKKRFGIPGKRLNLADVVGGGNGFGTGYPGSAIDIQTGRSIPDFYHPSGDQRFRMKKPLLAYPFVSAEAYPYIDGVFVPIDPSSRMTVSSVGQTAVLNFRPVNTGTLGRGIGYWQNPPQPTPGINPVLNGITYASPDYPAIMMKRNKGITFDLDAIRRDLSDAKILRFTAVCGVSETDQSSQSPMADFYVLVDGRFSVSHTQLLPTSGGQTICVQLKESDRFLTLITASRVLGAPRNHFVFAEPALQLVSMPANRGLEQKNTD